jgi:transcription antitermination factor NusG
MCDFTVLHLYTRRVKETHHINYYVHIQYSTYSILYSTQYKKVIYVQSTLCTHYCTVPTHTTTVTYCTVYSTYYCLVYYSSSVNIFLFCPLTY